MRKLALAAAVALAGMSSVPASAGDYRSDREIRRDLAEIERDKAELRRDLWANRHGARNWHEIEADRRELRRDQMELRRDLAPHRGW